MFPSFEFLGREIGLYSICALAGIFSAGIFALHVAKKRGLDQNQMLFGLLWAGLGAFAGGHLLYGITNIRYFIRLFSLIGEITAGQFFQGLYFVFGGMVFYGGLLGGMAAMLIYLKCKKLCVPEYSDICAPAVPLFHVFGRIGCFLGGCCYGVESDIGFIYTKALDPLANGVRRFPIQLAEAAVNLILFFILYGILKKGRLKGKLFCLYLLMYSVCRFILEFWRGDEIRGFILGISTSQFISIFIFIGALLGLLLIKKRAFKDNQELHKDF